MQLGGQGLSKVWYTMAEILLHSFTLHIENDVISHSHAVPVPVSKDSLGIHFVLGQSSQAAEQKEE